VVNVEESQASALAWWSVPRGRRGPYWNASRPSHRRRRDQSRQRARRPAGPAARRVRVWPRASHLWRSAAGCRRGRRLPAPGNSGGAATGAAEMGVVTRRTVSAANASSAGRGRQADPADGACWDPPSGATWASPSPPPPPLLLSAAHTAAVGVAGGRMAARWGGRAHPRGQPPPRQQWGTLLSPPATPLRGGRHATADEKAGARVAAAAAAAARSIASGPSRLPAPGVCREHTRRVAAEAPPWARRPPCRQKRPPPPRAVICAGAEGPASAAAPTPSTPYNIPLVRS